MAWLILKLVFVNAMLTVLVLFAEILTGISFFGDLGGTLIPAEWMAAILWILVNAAFLLYDRLIIVMLSFYRVRIRPRIKNLLK